MRLLELLAYHGSRSAAAFATQHTGDNSTAFGAYHSTRTGVFFSNNPEFAAMYGKVGEYDLVLHNTATDLHNLAYTFSNTFDAHNPEERNEWLAFMYLARDNTPEWEMFEDESGELFVPWLIQQGYDSAQFTEYNDDDSGKEIESMTTVVFDPKAITKKSVTESTDVVDNTGQPLIVYHGSDSNFNKFSTSSPSASGVNSSGIFFTQSLEVARGYGDNVIAAHLNIEDGVAFDFRGKSIIYFNGSSRTPSDLTNAVAEINNDLRAGYSLDDELVHELEDANWCEYSGSDFIDGIIMKNVDDSMNMFGGEITNHFVVFSPEQIKIVDQSLTESFFANNMDVLMPIVDQLMKTAARPLIYKLWKKSPNAVLALAAIKRLHDKGDPHPLVTLDRLSDVSVPIQFIKRLAWDAGLHDIPGVSNPENKPSMMPHTLLASVGEMNEGKEEYATRV